MPRLFILISILVMSCQQNIKVQVPDDQWKLFDSSAALPLTNSLRQQLEGVYTIEEKDSSFGEITALKWSYHITGKDTVYYLSMFCEKDLSYFICEGKTIGNSILLNGFWRKMDNDKTGKARFTIENKNSGKFIIQGVYGKDEDVPENKIQLSYLRPLYNKTPLEIVAHRGGGRITDFLPASENSIELVSRAARFGATGVELDVQLTKDGIPVLYHDARLNDRLTQKSGIHGAVDDYTYAELVKDFTLKKGEKFPRLRDALDSIVHNTPLKFVWMDVKDKNALPKLRELQVEFEKAAKSKGRDINFYIGIHDEEIYEKFKELPDYRNIPSICELEVEDASAINARIWAPLWTEGLQKDEVNKMHGQGRKAFAWTVDKPKAIREFISEGNYDGIVSNFPAVVAFCHYTRE